MSLFIGHDLDMMQCIIIFAHSLTLQESLTMWC